MLYFGLGFSFLGILWNVQKQIIKNLGKQINKNNLELKEELDKILKNRLYSELFLNEKEIYDKTCSYYNRINSELITMMMGNNTNLVLGNNIKEKDHTT